MDRRGYVFGEGGHEGGEGKWIIFLHIRALFCAIHKLQRDALCIQHDMYIFAGERDGARGRGGTKLKHDETRINANIINKYSRSSVYMLNPKPLTHTTRGIRICFPRGKTVNTRRRRENPNTYCAFAFDGKGSRNVRKKAGKAIPNLAQVCCVNIHCEWYDHMCYFHLVVVRV